MFSTVILKLVKVQKAVNVVDARGDMTSKNVRRPEARFMNSENTVVKKMVIEPIWFRISIGELKLGIQERY